MGLIIPQNFSPAVFDRELFKRGLAATTSLFSPNPGTTLKVGFMGDSICGGAGSGPWVSFTYALASLMRARYGDAGAGFTPMVDFHSANHQGGMLSITANAPGTNVWRWDADSNLALMMGPTGFYVNGGAGGTTTDQFTWGLSNSDNMNRGTTYGTYVPGSIRLHFTLKSANSGFQLCEVPNNTLFSGMTYSSGATFTATNAGASQTFTASMVTGVIPKQGSRILGTGAGTSSYINGLGGSNRGGAGTYTTNNSLNFSGSPSLTAEPNIDTTLNIPQTCHYRVGAYTGTFGMMLSGIYGDVVFSGFEHYNGNPGVTAFNIGIGGTFAYEWAGLNQAAMRQHWQNLDLDLLVIVAGTNDRPVFAPTGYGNSINAIVKNIRAGNPRTKILLVRATDTVDANTTNLVNYTDVLKNIALMHKCAFYDMRSADPNLANYTLALAAGFVNSPGGVADGIHPSSTANWVVANDIMNRYIIPVWG